MPVRADAVAAAVDRHQRGGVIRTQRLGEHHPVAVGQIRIHHGQVEAGHIRDERANPLSGGLIAVWRPLLECMPCLRLRAVARQARSPNSRPKSISIASNGGMRALTEISSGPSAVNTARYPPASNA